MQQYISVSWLGEGQCYRVMVSSVIIVILRFAEIRSFGGEVGLRRG